MNKLSLPLTAALFLVASGLLCLIPAHAETQDSHRPENEKAKRARTIVESSTFRDFKLWLGKNRDGNFGDADLHGASGKALATRRRGLMKELIELDPELAITHAIWRDDLRLLPASIVPIVERPFSSHGDFLVSIVESPSGTMTDSRIERETVIGGSAFKTFVYGRRSTMTTKLNVPLQGVMLDGIVALDEAPLRKIEPAEFAANDVDLGSVAEFGVAAEVGGELKYFSSESDLDQYVAGLLDWESKIGPDHQGEPLRSGELASPWTEGVKQVLVMRVDFPDRVGDPVDYNNQPLTQTRARELIINEVSPFFLNNSYGKTHLDVTVTPVLRLPQTQAFYAQGVNYQNMMADARAAAAAAGFPSNNFNLDILAFSYAPAFGFNARALVGTRGVWLNGVFGMGVTAHELGHNYGLWHSNLWRTSDGSVIGPGTSVEYGDPFDQMGTTGGAIYHFNAQYKRALDWLTDQSVQTVAADGIYRVFAQDSPVPGGIRALRIRKNAEKEYWVDYRELFTQNDYVTNGAIIRWHYPQTGGPPAGPPGTTLLDTTPSTGTTDAPLLVGQNLYDAENRIRISVVGKGNTVPESLDVRVELNAGCTFGKINRADQNFPANGGEGSVTVETLPGCRPPATSSVNWLSPISGESSPFRYIVAANYGSYPRIGTITVAGQTFAVHQAAAATACVPPPSSLVAHWRGEGNGLDGAGTNHGTVVNNMSFGSGRIGGAFWSNYDRGDALQVPDSPSLTLTNSMTVEGWLKLEAHRGIVIRRALGNTGSYEAFIRLERLVFIVWGAGGSGFTVTSDPLPLGQFLHFALTLDDATGSVKMFINGTLVRQGNTARRPNPLPGAAITVGNINGITDELSVYNRALSTAEIQAIYNAGSASTGATGKCMPAAPPVSVGGRVLMPDGQGLRNAVVSMTDPQGSVRTAVTSSFGFYNFENVPPDRPYTIRVSSKRYRFSPRNVLVNDNLSDVNFVGLE